MKAAKLHSVTSHKTTVLSFNICHLEISDFESCAAMLLMAGFELGDDCIDIEKM
jgi:hypothetical protein